MHACDACRILAVGELSFLQRFVFHCQWWIQTFETFRRN